MKKSKYLMIYEKLRNHITTGSYPFGSYLPSKRVTAMDYEASLVTVEHAYELLMEEGYIQAEERKGYVVIYQESDFFPIGQRKERSHSPVIVDPESFPISLYAKTIRKVMQEYGNDILTLREKYGLLELRSALAKYLARSRNMYVHPDQIVIVAGSDVAYGMIVSMLSRDVVYGIENPSYPTIQKIYENEGVQVDPLKMGTHGILTHELKRTKAKVLHVTPFSSYPTNVSADAGKRVEYLQWAIQKNGTIVEDDYASEYSSSTKIQETVFSLEPNDHVIYLNSFTKTMSVSIRVTYMILPKNKKKEYLNCIAYRDCGVTALTQLVLAQLINDGSFERHLNKVKRQRRKRES